MRFSYCAVEVGGVIQILLEPKAEVQALLTAARLELPRQLIASPLRVATKTKLEKHRPSRLK